MRRLKATMLYRDTNRTVVLIESLEIVQHRESAPFHLLASLKPLAVVISEPNGVNELGLDGNPTEIEAGVRALVEDIS